MTTSKTGGDDQAGGGVLVPTPPTAKTKFKKNGSREDRRRARYAVLCFAFLRADNLGKLV